jgi:hypothetical protein
MADYEKPLIHVVDASGNKVPATVSMLTSGGGGDASAANQVIGNTSLANIDTKTPALGQALASASVPVVLPAAQITTLTPPTSVGISGTLPAFANTPTFNIGTVPSLTFTNTSFTANAGTNLNTSALALESGGNLASINTKLPSSLTVSATRLLVDGSQVTQPVSMAVAPTSTLANVASSATSVTILAANSSRKTVIIANDSTAILYLKFNAGAASTSSYTVALAPLSSGIPATITLNGEDYSGEIRGIWASANGFARVTEIV